ncbi:MAG: cyanophycinase [Luteimonas sp.]|nr:cyanophycinase [Luteimonas sp.]
MVLSPTFSGFCRAVLLALLALGWSESPAARAAPPEAATAHGAYEYYAIGDLKATRPEKTEPGLMLVGGGEWPYDAFRWMIKKSGHGHIVILRASGAAEAQDEFYKDIGGVASAQTFVFSDRSAASDPRVLAAIRKADGVFIAGGDQSNYVRYWKDTPLSAALDQHVRDGRPIGGTSAGLAILGAYSYGAMDGGSLLSEVALQDPFGPEVTLVDDFLHMPWLDKVITDSHFGKRERLGRLIAFVARLSKEQHRTDLAGIGVDENTALCIDGDGVGRVFSGSGGYAWLVRPQRQADVVVAGEPLTFRGVPVVGVGPHSRLSLKDFAVEQPAFTSTYDVEHGRLEDRSRGAQGLKGQAAR